jgi:hypothetical protein
VKEQAVKIQEIPKEDKVFELTAVLYACVVVSVSAFAYAI